MRCPIEGCENVRNRNHMMCRTCWGRVSVPTRSRVYAAWRGFQRTDDPEDYGAYLKVREQAIREAEA